jgi:hypothetical protein
VIRADSLAQAMVDTAIQKASGHGSTIFENPDILAH